MMIKKLKYSIGFLLTLFVLSSFTGVDITQEVINGVKAGNAKEICKNFDDNVDLKVGNKEEMYSRAQAELILKEFFSKHQPKNFTLAHKNNARAGSEYTIGSLETSDGKFRVYFLIKNIKGKSLVQQFRIETEK